MIEIQGIICRQTYDLCDSTLTDQSNNFHTYFVCLLLTQNVPERTGNQVLSLGCSLIGRSAVDDGGESITWVWRQSNPCGESKVTCISGGSNGNLQIQRYDGADATGASGGQRIDTRKKGDERGRAKEVVKGDVVEGEGYRRRTRRRRVVVVVVVVVVVEVVVVVVFCERGCVWFWPRPRERQT